MYRKDQKRFGEMAADNTTQSPSPNTIIQGPERLVGLGFRHWLTGYRTGNISCWEQAWQLYETALGPQAARAVVNELSGWVRAVSATARRDIDICPLDCTRFCQDECLAISMVAASQHQTCPAMRACAFALIESAMIDEVVTHSESFAFTLKGANQFLSPNAIVGVPLSEMAAASEARQ